MQTRPQRPTLTPSALNALARDLLEDAFDMVWVEGELSGCTRPASGHLYFTLKDARAQVRCAMFRPRVQWLRLQPRDGMQVLARGRLTLYEPRGDCQLLVENMEEAGEGALRRAFEELRARLESEGLFDPARRRNLPPWPRRIAVVTSPSGAAVHDVLSVLRRRFPLPSIDVVPVPVQGTAAPALIIAALARLDQAARHDVVLLTRGGGSLEDLQAFNDEALARAVRALRTPIVVAIGHEVDVSIAELAADMRAPTPSAAAELLVPDRIELGSRLQRQQTRIEVSWRHAFQGAAQRLDQTHLRLQSQRPQARLLRGRERLQSLRDRLHARVHAILRRAGDRPENLYRRLVLRHPARGTAQAAQRLAALVRRLSLARSARFEHARAQRDALGRALNALSPLATLARGFVVLRDAQGRIVGRVGDATPGSLIEARLADGRLLVRVETVQPDAEANSRPDPR